jgi:glutamyl-tRNA synthetase/nondiscriminating glutamyl-tRNA synthetase
MPKIRVRFAPSPTGYVHVGNARTALFNWLFARRHGGAFVLRIEDTDVERSKEEYEKQLFEDLRWFGLDWDEGPNVGGPHGPYRQSERKEIYRQHALNLIDAGHAYFCFCSAEQLESERQAALKAGQQPRYSGRCRIRPREESARKVAAGEPAAIRLKIAEGELAWRDLVHGPTSFASEVIGDWILVRSEGYPAYNYAVVIDDHLMEITHVIRGDDHISNTPRQLALYRALGWQPPEFAHLSTILGPDRARLSKRHGATALQNFRDMGILPEALRNYLALLGWSPADGVTEIMSREQLIAQFSLDHIIKAPAVFDEQKLFWMNRHYMKVALDFLPQQELPPVPPRGAVQATSQPTTLVEQSVPFLRQAGYLAAWPDLPISNWLQRVLEAVLKNLDRLDQVPASVKLIFDYDAAGIAGGEETRHVLEDAAARDVLKSFVPKMLALNEITYERFREVVKAVEKETGKKGKDLFHPIRVALTGAVSGPELEKLIPVFEEGAKLPLARHVKSVAERLREFEKLL